VITLKKINIFIVLLFWLPLAAFANQTQFSLGREDSFYWQKTRLQKEVRKEVEAILQKSVDKNDFIIKVEIFTETPSKPTFGGGGDDKLDDDGVRPTEKLPTEAPEDNIVFSKFAIEAPLVNDLYKKEKALQEGSSQFFSNYWDFSEARDFKAMIKGIVVSVIFSEKIEEAKRAKLEGFVQDLDFQLGGVSVAFEFAYQSLDFRPPKKIDKKKLPKKDELLEHLQKWSTPIGIVLGSFILGLMLLIAMSRIQSKNASSNNNRGASKGKAKEDSNNDMNKKTLSKDPQKEDSSSKISGAERFEHILTEKPTDALSLVRRWLGENHGDMLVYLLDKTSNEKLSKIFDALTAEERESWKGFLDEKIVYDVKEVDKKVSEAIISFYIIDQIELKPKVRKAFFDLNMDQLTHLIKENLDFSDLFSTLLSTNYIAKVLTQLSDEDAKKFCMIGATSQTAKMKDKLSSFEKLILDFHSVRPKLFGINKFVSVLKDVGISKEKIIFETIALSEDMNLLKAVAIEHYPSSLITKLNESILKDTLEDYNFEKRASLFLAMSKTESSKLINIFAKEGSLPRQMIEIEMNRLKDDLLFNKSLKENKDQFWEDFVRFTREKIANSLEYQELVDESLTEWASEILENSQNYRETA
jgi:hypothetical protein